MTDIEFKWGRVTSLSPLRVLLDGDEVALPFAPDSLVDPNQLVVGDRVRCELANLRLVIHGRAGAPAAVVAPVGMVAAYAGGVAPAGWLLCDGSAVSRVTYAALFAAIGTAYGAGNGSSTFNLPNLKGRVPVGRDAGQGEFDVLGETGGAKTHTLTVAEMPSHAHGQYVTANSGGGAIRRDYVSDGDAQAYPQGVNTGSTGGGGAHNNLQPYLVMNFIIKSI